ncbi:hypothetical protein [Pseudomonas kurunegalensis]|uniref:hypothetical protein n=1 Tax=Pseudomonas kurunegalensis TaxID=485880 RepID=UPI0028956C5A|nr:hypothetical protein [Pseudomonas kurunegalensis]MDT3749777.1 hypothetical protein [Pseudomonas kurunegalensis]
MIFDATTDTLSTAIISGVSHEGFTCTARDGRRLRMALVDDDGNIVEVGQHVAQEAWNVCIQVQHNFWIGQGYMRVLSKPIPFKSDQAA